jgi:hypothetical protein
VVTQSASWSNETLEGRCRAISSLDEDCQECIEFFFFSAVRGKGRIAFDRGRCCATVSQSLVFLDGKAALRFRVFNERRSDFLNCSIVWLLIGNLAHPEILMSSTVGGVSTFIWNEVRKLWVC